MAQNFFIRTEKKYLLDAKQFADLTKIIEQHMQRDAHFRSQIDNVYFDTPTDELVIASLEKPNYKYKVRARSYGQASADKVFLEIKSKLDGVVYKRRAALSLADYYAYLDGKKAVDSQVMREVDFLFRTKQLGPKLFISYDRLSYAARDGSDLRITFDTNLRSRENNLDIGTSSACTPYFDEPTCIMEIKTRGGMPFWLTEALSAQHVYPSSFSKYGRIFQKHQTQSHQNNLLDSTPLSKYAGQRGVVYA